MYYLLLLLLGVGRAYTNRFAEVINRIKLQCTVYVCDSKPLFEGIMGLYKIGGKGFISTFNFSLSCLYIKI